MRNLTPRRHRVHKRHAHAQLLSDVTRPPRRTRRNVTRKQLRKRHSVKCTAYTRRTRWNQWKVARATRYPRSTTENVDSARRTLGVPARPYRGARRRGRPARQRGSTVAPGAVLRRCCSSPRQQGGEDWTGHRDDDVQSRSLPPRFPSAAARDETDGLEPRCGGLTPSCQRMHPRVSGANSEPGTPSRS